MPLTVIASRETYADGHEKMWLLLSTQSMHNPATARREYHLGQATEERYRQLKCFADRDEARKKIGETSRRQRRELSSALTKPRPP